MTVEHTLLDHRLAPRAMPRIAQRSSPWFRLTAALVLCDGLAVAIAFALAYLIRFWVGLPLLEILPHRVGFYSELAFWAVPVWLGLFGLFRLYDRRRLFSGFQEYLQVANACTAGLVAVIVISFLDASLVISRGWLLLVWALTLLFVGIERFTLRRLVRQMRRRGMLVSPTLIVGANDEGRALAEHFLADPGAGLQLVGFIDNATAPGTPVCGPLRVLGGLDELDELVRKHDASEVVIAPTALAREELLDLYRVNGNLVGAAIHFSSGLFEVLTTGVRVHEVGGVPLMTPERVRITGVDAVLKSILDYLGALVGLLVFAPALLIIALLVKLDSPGPVFHQRKVLGQSGRIFHAFKFRTMVEDADQLLQNDSELRRQFTNGFKLRVDPRVTRLGQLLRRTSLDELPQLLNVLRGEMSLVGPRMIAPDEAARYGKWRLNLLTVRPGLTGPWQVRGRSDIPYDERIRLSMDYIRNYSIWRDLEILLRTIPEVLAARGAY